MGQIYSRIILALFNYLGTYRKQGKICWAKLLQIPPNKVLMGKLLWYLTFKALKQQSLHNVNKYSCRNFHGTLENREKCETLAQPIFSIYGLIYFILIRSAGQDINACMAFHSKTVWERQC